MEQVVIIGGGLGGLICATELALRKIPFVLIEAEPEVGGRIRSDQVEGFTLDRGFQILLSGYPWVARYLDLKAIGFSAIKAGASIWDGQEFHRLVDPIRHPGDVSSALTTPVLSWGDRLRLTGLAATLYPQSPEGILEDTSAQSTAEFFRETKFSEKVIKGFLRPFFAGIFLEEGLRTPSNYFRFLFRLFGTAPAGLPAGGMGAISRYLSAKLPSGSVRLNTRVESRQGLSLALSDGTRLRASAVVVAGDQDSARALGVAPGEARPWNGCVTVYFAADASPTGEKLLALNGSGNGIVNSVLVLSDVAPGYAPDGKALVSVSLKPSYPMHQAEEAAALAREELKAWYGAAAGAWRHVRTISVPHALPDYQTGMPAFGRVETSEPGVFVAGDLASIPSQEGAATTGRLAAEAVARFLNA